MAKRVGKYKLSKKENTLSAFGDIGGTIPGSITLASSALFLTGLSTAVASESLAANQIFITGSAAFSGSLADGGDTAGKNDFNVLCITQ